MDEEFGPFPPSFTHLTFPLEESHGQAMTSHDPVSEIKRLFGEVEEQVNELREYQQSDELEAAVDETTLPRDLRQNILGLHALSTGLIEKFAVEILL